MDAALRHALLGLDLAGPTTTANLLQVSFFAAWLSTLSSASASATTFWPPAPVCCRNDNLVWFRTVGRFEYFTTEASI